MADLISWFSAAEAGDVEYVQAHMAELARRQDSQFFNKTALMYAAQKGKLPVVELLRDAEAGMRNENGNTALFYAAAAGRADAVAALAGLEAGAQNQRGETALVQALVNGHADCVGILAPYEYAIPDGQGVMPRARGVSERREEAVRAFDASLASLGLDARPRGGRPRGSAIGLDSDLGEESVSGVGGSADLSGPRPGASAPQGFGASGGRRGQSQKHPRLLLADPLQPGSSSNRSDSPSSFIERAEAPGAICAIFSAGDSIASTTASMGPGAPPVPSIPPAASAEPVPFALPADGPGELPRSQRLLSGADAYFSHDFLPPESTEEGTLGAVGVVGTVGVAAAIGAVGVPAAGGAPLRPALPSHPSRPSATPDSPSAPRSVPATAASSVVWQSETPPGPTVSAGQAGQAGRAGQTGPAGQLNQSGPAGVLGHSGISGVSGVSGVSGDSAPARSDHHERLATPPDAPLCSGAAAETDRVLGTASVWQKRPIPPQSSAEGAAERFPQSGAKGGDLILELSRAFAQASTVLQASVDRARTQVESYERANKALREKNLVLHEQITALRDKVVIYAGIIETLRKDADARSAEEGARREAQAPVDPGLPATRKDVWRVEQELSAMRAENRALADTVRLLVAKLEARELIDR